MADKAKLLAEIEDLDKEFLRLINLPESDWQDYVQADTHVIKTSMQSYNDNYVFRVEMTLDHPITDVYDALSAENRIVYDESFVTPKQLMDLDNGRFVHQYFQKEMFAGVLSARDCINVVSYNPDLTKSGKPNEKFISYKSVEVDAYPPDEEYVRAWNYPSGAFMKTSDPQSKKTEMVLLFQSDQKLWLPWMAINSGICQVLADFVAGLIVFLKDPKAAREQYKKKLEMEQQEET